MKKKFLPKKIGSGAVIRSAKILLLLLCVALIGGTVWFFITTLDALTLAQKSVTLTPPKIAAVNPQQLDNVLKAVADRRADSNILKNDYRDPFEAPAEPIATPIPTPTETTPPLPTP